MRPRLHLLLLLVITSLSLAGLSPAHAQEAPACEVCVTRRVVERCAEDARQVDAARGRVVACQRQVDAAAGATAELRAQIEAIQRLHAADAARHAREVAALEQRPRWRTVAVSATLALVMGGVAWELVR